MLRKIPILLLIASGTVGCPARALADENAEEEITVSARTEDTLSAGQNATAVHLEGDWLRSLPAKTEDALAAASLFIDPTASGAAGTRIVVDGVEGDSLDVPSSSIKAIAINSNPYSAEFGRPGRGRIEVTTRPGSRRHLRKRLELAYRDNAVDAQNPFDTVRPPRQRESVEGEADGPWLGGKATFFVGADFLADDSNSFVAAVEPTGPVRETLPLVRRSAHLFGRADIRLAPPHLLSVRYAWSEDRLSNLGVGAFDLPERAWNSKNQRQELRVAETASLSSAFQNEFRVDLKSRPQSSSSATDAPAVLVNGSFNSGGSQISRRALERDLEFQDLASYQMAQHSLRVGAVFKSRHIDYLDASNFGGTFTFSDLASFVNSRPLQYSVNAGIPRVTFMQNEVAYFVQDEIRLSPRLDLLLGLRHEFQSNLDDHSNLAPRLALSASTEDGRTFLRAGSGVFYERQPPVLQEQSLLLDGSHLRQLVLSSPGYPLVGNPLSNPPPPSVLRVDPFIRTPYVIQASLGVEHKLDDRSSVTAEYTMVRGSRLYRMRDVNAPLPATGVRPNPGFLNIDQFETSGSSRANSLSLGLRTTVAARLQLMAQYTLSHTIDDTSCGFAQPGLCSPPADSDDLRGERGPSDFDQRHRFSLAGVLTLPRDFTFGCLAYLHSGTPYNITTGFDDNGDTVFNDRPSVGNPNAPFQSFAVDGRFVGGTPGVLYDGQQAVFSGRLVPASAGSARWLVLPGPGNVSRNTARGPGFADVDLRLAKGFALRKRSTGLDNVEVRLDAFNLLNHVNYTNYVGNLTSRYFGRANDAYVPREIQLSVRARF